jgi:FAD/FMN-containing dehydrogenase
VNDDVALSMAFARRWTLQFAVRGGGHSAAGYGLSNGMVLSYICLAHAAYIISISFFTC